MQDARSRLRSLNRRFDNASAVLSRHADQREQMTEGARRLLDTAQTVLRLVREGLEYRWNRVAEQDQPDTELSLRALCNDFSTAVRFFSTSVLPVLAGSDSSLVPVELEPAIGRFASRLRDKPVDAVLYASGQLNYSIESLSEALDSVADVLPGSMRPKDGDLPELVFFRVPAMERDTASMHALILGHELGHLWDWASALSTRVTAAPMPEEWMKNGQPREKFAGYVVESPQRVQRWASEVVADIVSVHLLGPAALFAIDELSNGVGPWNVDSSTHPGTDRRIAIMLEVLDRLGYGELDQLAPMLAHYREETAGALARECQGMPVRFATGSVDPWDWAWGRVSESREALYDEVADYFAGEGAAESFGPAQFMEAIAGAGSLSTGRPFGERRVTVGDGELEVVSATVAEVFNAGWMVHADGLDGLGAVLGLSAEDPRQASQITGVLETLLLKSLEIVDFVSRRPQPRQPPKWRTTCWCRWRACSVGDESSRVRLG